MGQGDPLIIMHGLFGNSDNWLSLAKELSAHRTVYLVDSRNHGRSPHSSDFSYPHMVEDLYELLTDFNLRTVSLSGHSMGGMVAMNFALEYPHRVRDLNVIDIAPRSYPLLHERIIEGLTSINLSGLTSRREADSLLAPYIDNERTRQFLLKNLYRTDKGLYAWRLNLPVIAARVKDAGNWLYSKNSSYDGPVQFIKGALSDYIQPEDNTIIAQLFPAAQIKVIPGATHWVHADAPQELLAMIISFLDNNH